MTDMVVLAFDGEDAAAQAKTKVIELNKQYMLGLDQVVEVVRKPDGGVKISHDPNITGRAALGGAFWGMLIGLIFLMPDIGFAVGTAAGAIAGHFSNYGISKDFIKQVSQSIQPGNSALFILADNMKIDRLIPMLAPLHPRVIRTSLSGDQEKELRDSFGSASTGASQVTVSQTA